MMGAAPDGKRPTSRAFHCSCRSVGESGVARRDPGHARRVFLFFSNRLGCFGSLIVSAIFTLILLALLGVL